MESEKKITYPTQLNIRVNEAILDDLEDICLFERRKRSELVRAWVEDKIKTYQRNPQYKAFLRLRIHIDEKNKR